MNITIDNTSPQITYGPRTNDWSNNHSGDGKLSEYFESSFHSTSSEDDYMQFDFNGTAVYIYGSMRNDHGQYSIKLDTDALVYGTGYSAEDRFQSALYSTTGLDSAVEHRITITHLPSLTVPRTNGTALYLDIDYLVVTTNHTGDIYTTFYDDFSPTFEYDRFVSYSTFGNDYYNGTNHITNVFSSKMTFPFNGSSVQLFGGLDTTHGPYLVKLDDGLAEDYNGSYFELHQNSSLYVASGLSDGPHIVTLTNWGSGSTSLDFDYAVVNSSFPPQLGANATHTITIQSDTNRANPSAVSSPGRTSSAAIIGGAVAGGVVGVLLLGIVTWYCCRRKGLLRRRRKKAYEPVDLNSVPITHDHYSDGTEIAPYLTADSSFGKPSESNVNGLVRDQRGDGAILVLPLPTVDPAMRSAQTEDVSPPQRFMAASPPVGYPHPMSSRGEWMSPTSTASKPGASGEVQRLASPIAAHREPDTTSELSGADMSGSETRYKVSGRETDMGPAGTSGEESEGILLPPDYRQATQPFTR